MNNKQFWITCSLVNLCVVALLGFILRSKILFPLHFINFQNLINAHSHFAFGGWVTLAFLNLFTHTILPLQYRQRAWYQCMLWGLLITSLGMLFTFPFQGYGLITIIFSTLFIFFTYGYCWAFTRDVLSLDHYDPASILGLAAGVCLVVSSIGPFTLAYMLATRSGNVILYKDAIYFYLHFQYNGFFLLSVFALLFFARYHGGTPFQVPPAVRWFTRLLIAAVIPSFFLSLLWHSYNPFVKVLAIVGALLIIGYLFCFFLLFRTIPARQTFNRSKILPGS